MSEQRVLNVQFSGLQVNTKSHVLGQPSSARKTCQDLPPNASCLDRINDRFRLPVPLCRPCRTLTQECDAKGRQAHELRARINFGVERRYRVYNLQFKA